LFALGETAELWAQQQAHRGFVVSSR
jgi:hypothetical protein